MPQRTKSSRFCRRLLPQPTLARSAVNKQRIDVCCTVACSTFRTWRAPQRPMEEANLVSIPQLPHTQNITSFYSFRHFTVLLLLLLILLLLLLSKICGRSSFCICHRYGHPVVLYILPVPVLLPLFGTNGTTFCSLNVTLVEVFFFFVCVPCVCVLLVPQRQNPFLWLETNIPIIRCWQYVLGSHIIPWKCAGILPKIWIYFQTECLQSQCKWQECAAANVFFAAFERTERIPNIHPHIRLETCISSVYMKM